MAISFDAWVTKVNGKYIDIDNAFGPQCHDIWLSYIVDVYGISSSQGQAGPPEGRTENVWLNFPRFANLANFFTKIGPGTGQRGDVAFWAHPTWPGSHVAVVIEDQGKHLRVVTQNPGATKIASLTKNGLRGYLRPKNAPTEPPTTPEPEKGFTLPALIRTPDGTIGFVGDNGELTPLTSMTEVESLQATGIVGPYVDLPDRLVWNTLTAITARKIAERK
ncbi:hypothetical protein [Lysinibacter sp. HNR]|uniref:hypothetical protein n=1 Tax=Lysinibacter sp. HNR TaxID=3031408 RepID=UPI002435B62B|nr:hypothetical protein [Lysinibacter sp. HNR]WGD37419.1 hypothetical protein FrondiHNR_00405 [Lysinibacter sp. HNR]